jgi:hypothetical protein
VARKITETAVVVPVPHDPNALASRGIGLRSRVIYEMQMRSSIRGIPDPLEPWENTGNHRLKPQGWWLTERAAFVGELRRLTPTENCPLQRRSTSTMRRLRSA